MEIDLGLARRARRATQPDYATLVAVAVARQSASRTAQIVAAAQGDGDAGARLVHLFGTGRSNGAGATGCFNSDVAALLRVEARS
ncbi:hypothetical protein GVO57_02715 [Sphingomonas changnyeongensis]|uniref:Uncharacterized protein n=1 Tax=Sphingomonas changnyeongensis TaxID=2698679 RepID=A0A7Z2NV11_9SPHN|nr:hypothetical protein [Sphingomonas changnyeongensis]QHL89934.1 hypothetical protein GVO57_02715 [Sphingomonas changnyeongensis]